MTNESQIKDALNEITNGKVKEVSLVYDLGEYLKMERDRDKKIKEISTLKAERAKIISSGGDPEKLEKSTKKLTGALTQLIRKVIEMHIFKDKFNNNRELFFKSRRLFVTFKNFIVAREFKDLYNRTYRENRQLFPTTRQSPHPKKQDPPKRDLNPTPDASSSGKMTRNEEKYVDVDNKLKYRGSTISGDMKTKLEDLVEKQKRFSERTEQAKSLGEPKQQFYSELPKNYDQKLSKELKRGILSKMMSFYRRSVSTEEMLKIRRMREVFGPDLVLKRSIDPKYINWDYHSESELGLLEMVLYSIFTLVIMPAICFFLNYQYYKLDLM